MLGIQREMYEKNGIMYLEMRQPDYLDTTIKQFKSQMDAAKFTRNNGIVECPVPPNTFLSVAGDPEKEILPPTEEEYSNIISIRDTRKLLAA